MTTEQSLFFELVRAGLWGTAADASRFGGPVDWDGLCRHARNQTLLGVVLDGIQTLPDELRPARSLYLPWCAAVLRTEDNNRRLDAEVGRLYALLRPHGIEPVLLKGQGTARNYLRPLHRQCGDIDLYVGRADYERVNRLLAAEGVETEVPNARHSSYRWHGVIVENHRLLSMRAPRADRRLQQLVAAWHGTSRAVRFDLAGCEAVVPPVEFDVLYLLAHAVHHLMNVGIGFRQICDWACLLRRHRATIDREAVACDLRAVGLDRAARVFGALTVACLGLTADEVPLPFDAADEELARWLLDEIWACGNFGRAGDAHARGYWRHKWHTFRTMLGRYRRVRRIAPAETAWNPLRLVAQFFRAQLLERFGRRYS